MTVSAQLRAPLPERQRFWLCADPACGIVYFGERGATFETGDLHVVPGFKETGSGLLCYCFGFTRADFERERAAGSGSGPSAIEKTIRERTRAGACDCEVRNPTGHCCLGEIARHLRSLGSPSTD